MSHPLLDCRAIDQEPEAYLDSIGTVFTHFGPPTQDSGNISYGVQINAERYFVKTAELPADPLPFLDHANRVALLRNAARLSASISHPLLPILHGVIESPRGPILVYPWLDGELLGVSHERRDDPQSAFQRFRSLPLTEVLTYLDAVYELHEVLARASWVASDFYDGSLLYHFAARRLWVVDLDSYHDGPFRNEMGRMLGSTRFMAPEEFEQGVVINEQTTVFVMGRTALVFLSKGTLDFDAFCGSRALWDVVAQACHHDPVHRFPSMTAFRRAWLTARRAL